MYINMLLKIHLEYDLKKNISNQLIVCQGWYGKLKIHSEYDLKKKKKKSNQLIVCQGWCNFSSSQKRIIAIIVKYKFKLLFDKFCFWGFY